MDNDMNKATIIKEIEEKHADMEALLAKLDREKMTQPGVYDELSVKDVLAHITAWERLMLGWLERSLRDDPPERFAPGYIISESDPEEVTTQVMDKLNEHIFKENTNKSLDEVMADFRSAHTDVVSTIESTAENDLLDPNRFAWRGGSPFWRAVGGNTFWHYQEHIDLLKAWLNGSATQ